MKRTSVFLIVVALVVCMSGCFTPFRMPYQLTLSSTEGGKVTTPGEGIFTYWEETTVDLVAEAEGGYHFANWTGNVTSTTTNITMNGNYSITAYFITPMMSAGYEHTVGLKSDGTIAAVEAKTEVLLSPLYCGHCPVGCYSGSSHHNCFGLSK